MLESLENDGCSSEYLIQKDILSKILDEIFEQNNEDAVLWKKSDTEDSNRRTEESKEKYLKRLADNDTGQGRVMIPIDLRKSKVIRELVLSKTFVNIAQNFLPTLKQLSISDFKEKYGTALFPKPVYEFEFR